MNHTVEFERLLDNCIQNNQYVGLGNPNAKILFIGKEAGANVNEVIYHGMGQSWKNVKSDYSSRFVPCKELKNENLRDGKHTWQKYQKLFELIFSDQLKNQEIKGKSEPYEITFVENIFTTELSNLAALTTKEAKKNDNFAEVLKNRKEHFWKSDYIKQFPIVLIFASDNRYIETKPGEVCKLFDVEFQEPVKFAKSDKYWVHYAKKDKHKVYPKLVIHTRQLTNGASNELIESLAHEVKSFVKKYSLEIKVK